MIEYGLIAGLLAVAILALILGIGEGMRDDVFGAIIAALQQALTSSGG